MDSAEVILRRTAASQYGLFNRAQAKAAGLSNATLRYRTAKGVLRSRLPDVYCIEGFPDSWEGRAMEAVLWAGEGTAVSHRAAARLWGFDGFKQASLEISTVGRKQVYKLQSEVDPGMLVHRVDSHLISEITEIEDVPVTSARRTIIDLAGVRHHRVERVLDASLARKVVSVGEMWLLLEEPWMRGRRGRRIVHDLLIPRTTGLAPTESEAEVLFERVMKRSGLPMPVRQFPIELPSGSARLDFAYPELEISIEIDGYAWHMDPTSFERDRIRDNELECIGWRPLRFTWGLLKYRPNTVIQTVEAVYRAASAEKATKFIT